MSIISGNYGTSSYMTMGGVDTSQYADTSTDDSVDAASQAYADPQATCEAMAANVMTSQSLEDGWGSMLSDPGPPPPDPTPAPEPESAPPPPVYIDDPN